MKVFLSCVSSEFRSYRLKLAVQLGALKGKPYEVKVQEDFEQGGFTLLDKLADYVRECDLVIHLVGDACGSVYTCAWAEVLSFIEPANALFTVRGTRQSSENTRGVIYVHAHSTQPVLSSP